MELSELRMAIYKSNFTAEEYNGLIDIIQETQMMYGLFRKLNDQKEL